MAECQHFFQFMQFPQHWWNCCWYSQG